MFYISLIEIEKDPTSLIPYDPDYWEEDGISNIAPNICDHLQEINCARFIVQGFQDILWSSTPLEYWPVDVRTDLLTIIEELPGVVQELRKHHDSSLFLCEQGIEKDIRIHIDDGIAELTCFDYSAHKVASNGSTGVPDISSTMEKLPVAQLIEMLENVVNEYIRLAIKYCADIDNHPTFRKFVSDWKNGRCEGGKI